MRYVNWDVLVFPDECKIPLQEFKTSCQVILDSELHSQQSLPFLLPTVTCFIPSLNAGAAFRVSIHSWQNPETSQHIQSLKSTGQIMFEARLFIDGRIAGSKWFHEDGPWPSVIDLSIDMDKHGELEKLKFPTFKNEVLSQNYWHAGDELGRIKLLIAEGFSCDNLNYPFERIKNVVSFSFQHAPLDILEVSSIAWPNASMWRPVQVSTLAPYHGNASPGKADDHTHSPRRQTQPQDPFVEQTPVRMMAPPASFRGWRQASNTSMSESVSSLVTHSIGSRKATDLGGSDRSGHGASLFDSICKALVEPQKTPDLPGGYKRQRVVSSAASEDDPTNTPRH